MRVRGLLLVVEALLLDSASDRLDHVLHVVHAELGEYLLLTGEHLILLQITTT